MEVEGMSREVRLFLINVAEPFFLSLFHSRGFYVHGSTYFKW